MIEPLEQRLLLSVSLLDDINQVATSTNALGQLTDNNGTLLFADSDGLSGTELWKSDGTSTGTSLVKDINPGPASSSPTSLTSINGTVYFTAIGADGAQGLWKSDGTTTGTVQISTGGAYISQPTDFVSFGGEVYFLAGDSSTTSGGGLWETDGNSAHEVKDISDSDGYSADGMLVFNHLLYLINQRTTGHAELIQSDGTAVGTSVVQAFNQMYPVGNLSSTGTQLFLTVAGNQLWRSDGTVSGTLRVATIGTGSSAISDLTALGGNIYFSGNDGVTGSELWTSDGTSASEVKDIVPGANSSSPTYLTAFGGKLYFQATDSSRHADLWSSDGTAANTSIVVDLVTKGWISLAYLLPVGNELYFAASGGSKFNSIWMTDGTAAGTTPIEQFSSSQFSVNGQFVTSAGRVFFPAVTSSTGLELWETSGTASTTQLVKDIYPGTVDSVPNLGPSLNGELFFTATDGVNNGANLWETNGTSAGTTLLFNVYADGKRTFTRFLGSTSSYAYFSLANTNVVSNEYELWRTDGTSSGTIMLAQYSYPISTTTPLNGKALYFVAPSGAAGSLYSTDGTVAGTQFVANNGLLSLSRTLNGVAYGDGTSPAYGEELWRTDGTAAGTYSILDLAPGSASSTPSGFQVVGTKIFFMAMTDGTGKFNALYQTDGTYSGTKLVAVVPDTYLSGGTGSSGSSYFLNDSNQLWVSDGTAAGTHMLSVAVAGFTDPNNFVGVNGSIIFEAYDSGSNYARLYRSDGTTAGTYPLGTVYPEWEGGFNYWTLLNNACYIVSSSPSVAGIWRTDGTLAGTYLVDSVTPGENGSYLSYEALGNQLLFAGDDNIHGDELWQYTTDAAPLVVQSALYSPPTSGLSFEFSFNRAASGYAGPASLTLQNLTTNVIYKTVSQVVTSGNLIVTFPGVSTLPDGNYVATLPPGAVADANGNPLSVLYTYSFYILAGDANGDRHVDASDLAIVMANMGKTGQTYAQGDFNGDGIVDAADLGILQSNINVWLPTPGEDAVPTSSDGNTILLRHETPYNSLYFDIYEGSPTPSTPTYRALTTSSEILDLTGGVGSNSLSLDFGNGNLPAGVNFNGGSGSNTLTLLGTNGAPHTVAISPGVAVFDATTTTLQNVANIIFNTGTTEYGAYLPYTVSITGVTVTLPAVQIGGGIVDRPFSALNLNAGGELKVLPTQTSAGLLDPGDRQVLNVGSLSISGLLDLGDGDLIVAGDPPAEVSSLIRSGFTNGSWAGVTGITSSAASEDFTHRTTLASTIDVNAAGGALYSTFDKLPALSDDTLIKFSYFGDANLDGQVDGSDYSLIDNGYLNKLTSWYNGDFNYDGVVDGSDYTLIDNAFNSQGASLASSIAAETRSTAIANSPAVAMPRIPGFSNGAVQPVVVDGSDTKRRKPGVWDLIEPTNN